MRKNLKIAMAVAVVAVIAGAGIYEAYILSAPPAPCAGVITPSGPSGTSSSSRAAAATGTQDFARAQAALTATLPRSETTPPGEDRASDGKTTGSASILIPVVAAENFWGSLVSQLGGTHVSVTSIITDPNTDPHEYQSNDSDAIAIKDAQYVILNNVGYDDWASALVAADGTPNQTVLNIGDYLGVHVTGGIVTGNPHMWYNPTYVNQTVAWMYHNLTTIAPSLTGYFTEQYNNLTASLTALYSEVGAIRLQFAGTVVASTESIFVYLANATDLDLVSPPAFMEAVAEGNDPSDTSVVNFQCQLESGNVRVLVFNAQTVTPITTNMKAIAQNHNVSVMSVTETIVPPTATFQAWMGGELNSLYVALDAKVLGQ
ncbi:MAG: metal ABC transporter solute-binding protein, Zn/Mn family [Thermoplasmata archaeon]